MNCISHIVTTDQFNYEWNRLQKSREERVYESYLGFYLRLRNQLEHPVERPNTFGFLINTDVTAPVKSGVVFHKFWAHGRDPATVMNFGGNQKLLGDLEDLGLDFNYQKSHEQLLQAMPDHSWMTVLSFRTPHELAMSPEIPGSQLDDFKPQPNPGYHRFKLMDFNENRIFALE